MTKSLIHHSGNFSHLYIKSEANVCSDGTTGTYSFIGNPFYDCSPSAGNNREICIRSIDAGVAWLNTSINMNLGFTGGSLSV